jgi:two-component system LytT family response regulator
VRILLVDDESLARKRLKRLLSSHSDVEVVGEAADGEAAIAEAMRLRPDVMLLDVSMPGRTGTEVFAHLTRQLPEGMLPLVIFTTAHEEHAVEAFTLEALDYLVKPVTAEGLERALRRVRQRLGEGSKTEPITLIAYEGSKMSRVSVNDIGVIEVEDSQVWARTPAGSRRLGESLTDLEEQLPSPPFLRVSRSALLNLDWIAHVEPGFSGTLVATLRAPLGLEIAVARRRAAALRELL